MTTPSYYTTNDKGQAWLEVWVGDTAYGEIYRAVRPGAGGRDLDTDEPDTAVVKGKRCAVVNLHGAHVVVSSLHELPRDLDTDGYGESLSELQAPARNDIPGIDFVIAECFRSNPASTNEELQAATGLSIIEIRRGIIRRAGANEPDWAAIATHNAASPIESVDVRLCFFTGRPGVSEEDRWCASVWMMKAKPWGGHTSVQVASAWDESPTVAQAKAIAAWRAEA